MGIVTKSHARLPYEGKTTTEKQCQNDDNTEECFQPVWHSIPSTHLECYVCFVISFGLIFIRLLPLYLMASLKLNQACTRCPFSF